MTKHSASNLLTSKSITLILLLTLTFLSCSKEDTSKAVLKKELKIDGNNKREFSFEMDISSSINTLSNNEAGADRIIYKSVEENGVILSTLRVTNGGEVKYSETYQIDTTLTNYRLLQSNQVKQKAEALNFNLDSSAYALLSAGLNTFIDTLLAGDSIYIVDVQAVFFHHAIINTKLRGMGSNQYECVPHPAYILGRSFFYCMEDFIVPKTIIMGVFNAHPELLNDTSYSNLYNYVDGSSSSSFSYDKIYYFKTNKIAYIQTLNNIINNGNTLGNCSWWCPVGCGSDWGCCGNYSGCCLYWNFNCLVHDALCTNCWPPKYCFRRCIPDR